jgi:stage V sporulation protein G
MNITDIRVRRLMQEGRLRAVVSITVDDELAVHDIKVIEGPQRLFVAMPSRREENGTFRDIIHPITAQSRQHLENAVLEAYHRELEHQQSQAVSQLEIQPEM